VKGDRKPLESEAKLSDVFDPKATTWELDVKDLGAQISWQTVFIVEYVSDYQFPVSQ